MHTTEIGTQHPVISQVGTVLLSHRLIVITIAQVFRKQEEFLGGVGGSAPGTIVSRRWWKLPGERCLSGVVIAESGGQAKGYGLGQVCPTIYLARPDLS